MSNTREEDKILIDEDLNWIKNEFGRDHFMEIRTVTPTKNFYERDFDGTFNDAEFILERTKELMNIQNVDMRLEFLLGILDLIFHRTIQMVDMVGSRAAKAIYLNRSLPMPWPGYLKKETKEQITINF